jgi:hypothetical protein
LDWQAYGQFLDEAEFPSRLAYACFAKSESLVQSRQDSRHSPAIEVRERLKQSLGAVQAATLRRNPEPAAQEALTLRR